MKTDDAGSAPTPFDDGEFYDLLCGDLDYGLEFYLDLARRAGGPVLEVACGTGRVLIPCMKAGVEVEGVDLYPSMLARLEEKAQMAGLAPRLHLADMADFRLPRRFGLIMITFNSFVHNLTTDTQIATLRCCRDHLFPGGLLAFDAFFPGLEIIALPDGTRVLELEIQHPQTGQPLRLYDTRRLDRVEQVQTSLNEVEQLGVDGQWEVIHRSTTSLRWIYKHEMELLLRVAGFSRWEIYGGFDRRALTRETDGMVVEAWSE